MVASLGYESRAQAQVMSVGSGAPDSRSTMQMLEGVNAEAMQLHVDLDELEKALDHVLHPDSSALCVKGEGLKSPSMSPLSESIATLSERIVAASVRMQEITRHIE